jgi:hypothetical protein
MLPQMLIRRCQIQTKRSTPDEQIEKFIITD